MPGRKYLIFAAAFALSLSCFAEPAPDKSGYTLFKRTPESQVRELTTDRPDLTESPYTVDAGWWQVEMDLAVNTRSRDTVAGDSTKTTTTSFAVANIKVGLTNNIDLQTVIPTYTVERDSDLTAGTHEKLTGFGDITSRLKINFWGNDGGTTAFGLMPFVKWPTNEHHLGNKYVEGGLIVPFAVSLPGGWDLGMMTEFDFVRTDLDDGYQTNWVNTVTVGHDIVGSLGGYLELASTLTRGRDLASFDCGLTYGVGRHVQFDVGANIGLNRATDDLTIFAGLSVRF
jgi:hypothetical protein